MNHYEVTLGNSVESYTYNIPSQKIGDGPEIGFWEFGEQDFDSNLSNLMKFWTKKSIVENINLEKVRWISVEKVPNIKKIQVDNIKYGEDWLD